MLYCAVLYCTVLYCTVLYCTVLYCTVLRYLSMHGKNGDFCINNSYKEILYFFTDSNPDLDLCNYNERIEPGVNVQAPVHSAHLSGATTKRGGATDLLWTQRSWPSGGVSQLL